MDPINLEPRYSTKEIPGRCIKCLAEEELNNCLLEFLGEEGGNKQLELRYEALLSFLRSPESISLRDEAERYLADGKKVALKINLKSGKPEYELRID